MSGEGERLLRAREEAAALHEHWLELRERRLRGIAAELAAGLKKGSPAPSAAPSNIPHPPARRPVMSTAWPRGGRWRSRGRRASAATRPHCTSPGSARATRRPRPNPAARARRRSPPPSPRWRPSTPPRTPRPCGTHDAREALAAAEREHDERLAQRQDAERRAASRTSSRDALLRERAALTERLERARGEAPSVAARAAELERRAVLLSEAAEAAHTARGTAERLEEARVRLADAARQAGFETPDEAEHAVLPEAGRRELRERLERWQAEEAAVREELADPALVAAAERPAADAALAQATAQEADRRLREAHTARHAAQERVAALDGLGRKAAERAHGLTPLRTAYERVARLAGLAVSTSAENERRMRLESYVLAARLEQVAAAASARLARMSGGRYTLVHSDERASGRGRSGLGLHVVDAWTGAERDTSTLSGGETFFSSLALALGLADVVTEEAGGTRLETLFIDEGFGSLDEQTLDEVLDVLDSLRERDRCVGIVSHVADLRQRIPAQLEVTKSRAGSAVRHHSAPARG